MKTAVFSCLGLGDGLIALVLSNNLHLAGHKVTTFHPFMSQLQDWFPHLPIRPFPPRLNEYDRFFIIYEKSEWMGAILKECLEKHRSRTTVLNPIATPNTDYPFWEEGRFDGTQTFVENIYRFSRDILKLEAPTRENGIVQPLKKFPQRVILHPTSSRPGKNWPRHKFLKVAEQLKKEGFEPVFIVSPQERKDWPEAPAFASLSHMVSFVAESGYMIGNDSGIGHLASSFKIPTVTICRNERTVNFWRPSWSPGEVCLPRGWLPNIKWLRLRDQKWHWGISVAQVLQAFDQLRELGNEGAGGACLREKDVVGKA